jgi:hypothetical protein
MVHWPSCSKRRRFRLALRAIFLAFGLVSGYVASILVQERFYFWGILPIGLLVLSALAEFVVADILTETLYPTRTQAILDRLEENLRAYHDRIRDAIDRSIQSLSGCNRIAVSGTFHLRVELYSSYDDAAERALLQVVGDSGEGNTVFRSDVDNLSSSAEPAFSC